MIALEHFWPLVLFAFIGSMTPGPNNLMLLASGTNFGFRRSVPHILGVTLGFGFMVISAGAGLMQVFHAFPPAYIALKVLCIGYLAYLAWKIATAAPLKKADGPAETDSEARPLTFLQAALFQWVNPKAWGMAISAVSTYAPDASASGNLAALLAVLVIGGVFIMTGTLSTTTWTAMGTALREWLSDPKRLRIFNVSCAIALLASVIPVLF
jgi:threonine/homoserine/homoserine lactone efflux protein